VKKGRVRGCASLSDFSLLLFVANDILAIAVAAVEFIY
jgi:hypothetical protein